MGSCGANGGGGEEELAYERAGAEVEVLKYIGGTQACWDDHVKNE
jgi:hypothetical protein